MPDENREDERDEVDEVVELHLPQSQFNLFMGNEEEGRRAILEDLWGKRPRYDLRFVRVIRKGSAVDKGPHDPTYAKTCSGG